MSIDKQEIDAVISDISASGLRPAHQKDIRRTLLLARTAINGVDDKQQAISEAIAGIVICFANDAMFRREDFSELLDSALAKHAANCQLSISLAKQAAKPDKDEDSLQIKTKFGEFFGKGKNSFPALVTAVKYVVFAVVATALIWKMGTISAQLRDTHSQLERVERVK